MRTDAFEVGGQHRGYQVKEDAIHIFLNFEKIAEVKTKSEAVSTINKLVQCCPSEFKKDLEGLKDILYARLVK